MAGLSAGADDFIQKPIRPQFLRSKLNFVLQRTGSANYPALPAMDDGSAFEKPKLTMDQIIRELIDDQFLSTIDVFYQPVLDLKSGQVILMEALAHWNHPVVGDVPASLFVPIIEQLDNIEKLTHVVLTRVLSAELSLKSNALI